MHSVKFAEGTDNIIEGLGIPFGGPFGGSDLHGERFTKGTDFALDWEISRPLFYNHMLDAEVGRKQIGKVLEHTVTDDGVWVKAQLDKRSRYYGMIKELVEKEALGLSSGAWPHLVKTNDDGEITAWPWWEMSLTPTPANPDAMVYTIKAADVLADVEASKPTGALEAAVKAALDAVNEQTPVEALEPEPYAERTTRVLADLKAWVDHTDGRMDIRAKAGRELSRANVEALRTAYRLIGELLERNDKPEADEAEAAKAVAEFERLQAVLLGAIPE